MIGIGCIVTNTPLTPNPRSPALHTQPPLYTETALAHRRKIHVPMQEMRALPLSWEDPLEKETATHQCLQNPTDRGVRWTTVHGVTEELTGLVTEPWDGNPFTLSLLALLWPHHPPAATLRLWSVAVVPSRILFLPGLTSCGCLLQLWLSPQPHLW